MKEFRRGVVPGGVEGPVPGCPAAGEVLRCGEVEKRSASLFQGWKKKRAVLSRESLSLFPAAEKEKEKEGKEGKALGLGSIAKVDCVERTGKYLYFTLVTTDRREIDFRCPGAAAWDASIALALIDFQNQSALRRLFRASNRSPRDPRDEEEEEGGGMAAPTRHHQHHQQHRGPSSSSCP